VRSCWSSADSAPRCRPAERALLRAVRSRAQPALSAPQPSLDPGGEVGLGACVDHDGHESVVTPAELGTLTAVEPGFVPVHLEPGLVDEARDCILLHPERGHPPGVDHVRAGDQQAHLGGDRHHQRMVDVQQVVLDAVGIDAREQLPCGVAPAIEMRVVGHAVVEVVVLPPPLEAGHLDGELGSGGVLDLDQRARCRHRHRHQDEDRHDRPQELDLGVVHHRHVRHRAARFAVDDHRPDHRPEDDDPDHDAHPEDRHVQVVDLAADLGDPARQVELAPAGFGGVRCSGGGGAGGQYRAGVGGELRANRHSCHALQRACGSQSPRPRNTQHRKIPPCAPLPPAALRARWATR